ncbi:predicted protein [Thalassiosira pseudonana CCMP1335]|uniref:EF-hand domain-containing protein n=1 Tax=Thalassiosira pseudonana TaxID=35128 RepID=B8C279_THAPS|nr:predicted protein [Thalassiosira pseudonana CCMP1335]EED91900.1 predicted protein [Thalassiosira pseudonana CCMP1335]|mmetsp:Transcript_12330/g.26940  ORF Transcript_12330/g.26940 Transcript_12330/m.26940 type:complete len:415 (+) Transcript_12330:320-1564(+)
MRLPREGSRIRLVGLKNASLNGKVGLVAGYTQDEQRVMISFPGGHTGIVKVKPKQMTLLQEALPRSRRRFSSRNLRASMQTEASEVMDNKQDSQGSLDDQLLACSRDADMLFDKADVSGDGEISKREFEIYMKRHTKHPDSTIRDLFYMLDIDHDGYITRDEVRRVFLRQKLQNRKDRRSNSDMEAGGKMSMADLLGLDDDEMHELPDDVYSMLFLSEDWSQAFWYAISIFGLKLSLLIIIAIDLYTNKSFPPNEDVPRGVKAAQFLLLPVAVAIEEELITTFFIYSNLKWSETILELNCGAELWKYHVSNLARFLDGLMFLIVNITLLLQADDILSMFLNFAALCFVQTIDNLALHLARKGYLTEPLETVAGDVLLMKLPRNHNSKLQLLDSAMLVSTFAVLVVAWMVVRLTT